MIQLQSDVRDLPFRMSAKLPEKYVHVRIKG